MELNLLKEPIACYEELPELTQSCETGAETIVPDYCPDVARLIDTDGTLLLRACELTEGRATVSGAVRVTVLYLAEGERRARALQCTLPVEAAFDMPPGGRCTAARLEGQVEACQARLLNPRKLRVTATLTLALTPCRPLSAQLCTGVADAQEHGVQTLVRTQETSLLCAVQEKEFSFTDELTLPGSGPARELLRHRLRTRLTEGRCVSGKLIVKGVVCAELLYLSESETVESVSAQLPFSQVLDGVEDEAADVSVSVRLVDAGASLSAEDGRTVTVTAALHATALLRCTRRVQYVADLYSTTCELAAHSEPVALPLPPQRVLRSVPVRELVETGSEVRSVLACAVRFAPVNVLREEAALRTLAETKLLYVDEDGALLTAQRRIELSAQAELPPGGGVRARAFCTEVQCLPAAGGAELRFTAELEAEACGVQRLASLTTLQAEPRTADADEPSLTLREPGGQSLWQLAKACRTTVSAILEANELTAESDADAHTLLLIPRGR